MESAVWIVAIICYTIYQICALRPGSRRFNIEDLKALNELREKGVITQAEFEAKKAKLLD